MDKLRKFERTLQWNISSVKELIEKFRQLEILSLSLEWDKRKELDNIIQDCYVEIMKIVKNFEEFSKNNFFLY